jgi:hypothetical protein
MMCVDERDVDAEVSVAAQLPQLVISLVVVEIERFADCRRCNDISLANTGRHVNVTGWIHCS